MGVKFSTRDGHKLLVRLASFPDRTANLWFGAPIPSVGAHSEAESRGGRVEHCHGVVPDGGNWMPNLRLTVRLGTSRTEPVVRAHFSSVLLYIDMRDRQIQFPRQAVFLVKRWW